MEQKLYRNKSDKWGTESYVQTWDEWKRDMMPLFKQWYQEYIDLQKDLDESYTLDMWINDAMNSELEEVFLD